MLRLQEQLKRECGGLDMEEGDVVYVVAQTWVSTFLAAPADKPVAKIKNEPLVDLRYSSKRHKAVVLKPDVVAEKKYELVSESLWGQLCEEYNYDWEIQRSVIADDRAQEENEEVDDDENDGTDNFVVEIQPLAYQIYEWRSGFNGPTSVQCSGPSGSKSQSLVVLASRRANVLDLMDAIRNSGIPRSVREDFKPLFALEHALACQDKRVCLRVHAGAAWIPVARLLEKLQPAHSKPCYGTRYGSSKTLQRLESECSLLEIHEALGGVGGNPMVDLLLEGQCSNPPKEKWRAGKFFTEMAQLAWLYELKPGDRLDALDEDTKKWQEACVDKLARNNKIRVRYLGHENAFSGMLPLDSDAIAPPYSRVSDWRRVLKVGDLVQIGIRAKYAKTVRWRESQVTEIAPGGDGVVKSEDGQDIRLLLDDDEMWVSVDDDMMCLPGTHELSPAPIKRERTGTVISLDDEEEEDNEQAPDGDSAAKDARKKRKRNPEAQKLQRTSTSTTQIDVQLKKLARKQAALATELAHLADLLVRQSEQGQTEREDSGSDQEDDEIDFEVYTKPAGL